MGRGWPRTAQIDTDRLGTVHFDPEPDQPGGPGLFFLGTPIP